MSDIEKSLLEGLERQVQDTQRKFGLIEKWVEKEGSNYRIYAIILEVAAALELDELDLFKAVYDLLKRTDAAKILEQGNYRPTFFGDMDQFTNLTEREEDGSAISFEVKLFSTSRFPAVEACLRAALEIVKNNRGSPSSKSPDVTKVASGVQAAVDSIVLPKK